MGNVLTKFARLSPRRADAVVGAEERLLSPGGAASFAGTLTFGAGTLAIGDIIRVFAWGDVRNPVRAPAGAFGHANVRDATLNFFFNGGDAAGAVRASINPNKIIARNVNMTYDTDIEALVEWHFYAQITVNAEDIGGSGICDAWFLRGVVRPEMSAGRPSMAGQNLGSTFPIDTTLDNFLELTLTVPPPRGHLQFRLHQCSVEYLQTP